MMIKYLKEDINGTMSKFLYGKKGEKVMIIHRNNDMVLVANLSGNQYYLNEKHLTDEMPAMCGSSDARNPTKRK